MNYVHHKIDEVVVDVKVVLQIIKHGQDESRVYDDLDGFITGLSKDGVTEVTNSFRNVHPADTGDDYGDYMNINRHYQAKMLKRLRACNQDHISVGLYRKVSNFNFLTKADDLLGLMQFQQMNELQCKGTVFIIYDPARMSQGDFGLRAFRVSEKAMDMYISAQDEGSKPFSIANIKKFGLVYEDILEELPVQVRSSHLMNCLLHQIENERNYRIAKSTTDKSLINKHHVADDDELMAPSYSMASLANLKHETELMKNSMEELQVDTNKFLQNQRMLLKATQNKNQIIQAKERENDERVAKGERPIKVDIDEIDKMVKMPEEYNRGSDIVHGFQANLLCENIKNLSAGNVGKLFVAEGLQD